MRQALTIFLILMCLLGLVGCDPGTYHFDEAELLQNTTKIELYQYGNGNPKLIHANGRKKPVFDFSKATFLSELDDSRMEAVVKDIAAHEMLVFGSTLNEPIGKTLILHQSDGSKIVLFSCVYTSGKKLTRYYGKCNVFDKDWQFIEYLGDIDSDYVDFLEATYFDNNP